MDEEKSNQYLSKESLIQNNNEEKNLLDVEIDNQEKNDVESNIASVLSQIEVTDELIEEILADKERHFDLLSLPAEHKKAIDHFRATQFYDKQRMNTNEESKLLNFLK